MLGQLLHEQALLCTSVYYVSTFSSAQHRRNWCHAFRHCLNRLSHCHWTFFFILMLFQHLLSSTEKTWEKYGLGSGSICFAKAIPLKMGSEFFSEKINAKKPSHV